MAIYCVIFPSAGTPGISRNTESRPAPEDKQQRVGHSLGAKISPQTSSPPPCKKNFLPWKRKQQKYSYNVVVANNVGPYREAFSTPKWVEYTLAYCGAMAVQGDPLEWVSSHRHHHQVGLCRTVVQNGCGGTERLYRTVVQLLNPGDPQRLKAPGFNPRKPIK
jgi:hypothetical protein